MGRLPRAPPAWTSISWSLAPPAETPGLTRQEQTRSPAHIRPAGHCRHSLVAGPGCACDRFESLDLVESPCQTNTVPGALPPVPEPPLVPGCSLREARGRGDVLPGPKLRFHVQVRHQEGPPPPHPPLPAEQEAGAGAGHLDHFAVSGKLGKSKELFLFRWK